MLSLAFAGISFAAWAKPVNLTNAKKVAINFLQEKTGRTINSVQLFEQLSADKQNTHPDYYVFTASAPKSFVIVAGDDAVKPVLGYSTQNDFSGNSSVSPEVKYWLNWYSEQINYIREKSLTANAEVRDEWNSLLNAETNNSGSIAERVTGVQPLLNTTWNQLPWYNELCPTTSSTQSNPTGNAPTGCVATAMAQIMKYWENPTTGTGSHSYSTSTVGGTLSANFGTTTYDWNDMPNYLNSNSTSTQKNAIATLMYQCGVAVNMNYTADESGAYVINYGYSNMNSSQDAMPAYFGYSSNIQGLQRSTYTSDSNWVKMLKFEIDNGRPVLYFGQGSMGGHAFVFDGYNDNGYFHVNWGWGGISNGYFVIDDLSPSALGVGAGAGNFDQGQGALVMIEPSGSTLPVNPYLPTSSNFDLVYAAGEGPSSTIHTIHSGDAYSVTGTIKNIGAGALDSSIYNLIVVGLDQSTGDGYILDEKAQEIPAGQSYQYDFSTPSLSTLPVGDYYILYGYIAVNNSQNYDFVTDNHGQYIAETLTVLGGTGIQNNAVKSGILLFPNPANNQVTVLLKDAGSKIQALALYDAIGRKVLEKQDLSSNSISIPTGSYDAGLYFLKITTDKGSQEQKLFIHH